MGDLWLSLPGLQPRGHVEPLLVFVNIHRSQQITQHFIRLQVHIPAKEKKLIEFLQRPSSSGEVSFRQRTNGSERLKQLI